MSDFRIKVPKTIKRITEKEMVNPNYLMLRRFGSGETITSIAKKAKVSAAFVSAVENGKKTCPDYLLKIYEELEAQDGIAFIS